jgi:hypothetical protein
MKSTKIKQKRTRKRTGLTRKHMTDAMLISTAAGMVIADYLQKNPDLMELIARTHKINVEMIFKNGK